MSRYSVMLNCFTLIFDEKKIKHIPYSVLSHKCYLHIVLVILIFYLYQVQIEFHNRPRSLKV